jgi:hypothetical protein
MPIYKGVTVKLTGLEALDEQLRKLPLKVQRRAMIAGLRKGAAVYKKGGKIGAPVRSWGAGGSAAKFIGDRHGLRMPGFLKRSVISRTISPKKSPYPTIHIGPRQSAFYGQFFEYGRAERINRRRKGARRFPRKRFLSDAYRTRSPEALKAVRAGLWAAMQKEFKKITPGAK